MFLAHAHCLFTVVLLFYCSPRALLTFVSRRMPRVKAVIWDYYKVVDGNEHFASCQTCSERISRGGKTPKTYNTSNMIDHLQKKHPLIYEDYEEKRN